MDQIFYQIIDHRSDQILDQISDQILDQIIDQISNCLKLLYDKAPRRESHNDGAGSGVCP